MTIWSFLFFYQLFATSYQDFINLILCTLSLTGCPSAGTVLRSLEPWPPSSWSGSSLESLSGWPSDVSLAATTKWMPRSCWSHRVWPYWLMSCKYYPSDMQIFDAKRSGGRQSESDNSDRLSVRVTAKFFCFPSGSFPIAIAAINLSRARARPANGSELHCKCGPFPWPIRIPILG